MTPDELADAYFTHIRNRDIDGLLSLYADDATLTLPSGAMVEGGAAIRAFQLDVFARGAPVPTPGQRIVGERSIAVEISAALPDGSTRHTANFFYQNDAGRIARLSVYGRAM